MKIKFLIILICLSSCTFTNQEWTENQEYEFVDLRLPSGLLWATCNLGAKAPYECGDYYSWGEVSPKDNYEIGTYKWYDEGDGYKQKKYCLDADFGIIDGKNELEKEDDAAFVNWGVPWRMPREKEVKELLDGCIWTQVDKFKGVNVCGYIGVSKTNGDSIFFPMSGYKMRGGNDIFCRGELGGIWSSTNSKNGAINLGFGFGSINVNPMVKSIGCTVRAVREK